MHRGSAIATTAAVGFLALVGILVIATNEAGESEPDTAPPAPDVSRDASPSASASATRVDPARLLPNVRSLTARDLQIRGTGDDRRLHFAAWLANKGPGPLLVEPLPRGSCPAGQRAAEQVVHIDTARDGVFQRRHDPPRHRTPAGCMVDHPTHDHWHFDAMARYALITVDRSRQLAARDKVSFCLRDNTRVPGSAPLQRKEYFGECERNSPQGISPGWVDVYDVDTPGQSLRLPPGTPDGVYCLILEADPHGLLLETDETDNGSAHAVRIAGTDVRRADTDACVGAAG